MMDKDSLPKILTNKELDFFWQLYTAKDRSEWNKWHAVLSSEHFWQISDYVEKIEEEEWNARRATLASDEKQAEDDAIYRAASIFGARDLSALTLLDEFKIVNGIQVYGAEFSEVDDYFRVDTEYGMDKSKQLTAWQSRMSSGEQYTVFDSSSQFSLGYPIQILVNEKSFESALQFLVYAKAEEFRDRDAMKTALETNDPEQLLMIDSKIKFFEMMVWKYEIGFLVRDILKEKYTQHEELSEALRSTTGTTLVYADEEDLFWGTGIPINAEENHSRKSWRGKNLLGELLTQLRIEMFED
jgi:ribA/ribD-fused uncharacterized protein